MEAQYSQDVPQDDWGVEELGSSNDYPIEQTPSMPEQTEIEKAKEKETKEPQEPQGSEEKPDLIEYLFEKLETFNYPPRRLEDFSEEFVEEEIYPDGFKEIKVTIPDKYYGMKKRLTDQDLQTVVNEIMEGFNLALTKATRKDKKIMMEFTSQAKVEKEEQETMRQDGPGDDLDEIFGTKGNQKKERKSAQTLQEMLKEGHEKTLMCLERFILNGEK